MEELNKIVNLIENIEANNLQDTIETKEWFNKITSKEFGLIGSCSDLLIENLNDESLNKNIILVLRKLLQYSSEGILDQLKDNKTLVKGINKYIINTKPQEFTQEVYPVLANIVFSSDLVKLPDEIAFDLEFVNSSLNHTSSITSEDIMNSLMKIYSYQHFHQACEELELNIDKPENIFNNINSIIENSLRSSTENKYTYSKLVLLKSLPNHPKYKLFLECILRILVNNSFSKEDSIYVMILILDLMNYNSSSLFLISDIESLLDYMMKRLESTTTDCVRDIILGLIERVTFFPGYNKSYYKKYNLEELMDNHLDSDIVSDNQKKICEIILENLKK